ncbi:MAG TPA: hypothetical protein PLD08_03990 [Acetomicrobium flavidum]|uniref:Uncharacterized protein n=1 Tax=Acetomicrobium mobile (strain ATCC BAA-54 / DSM 13181 / JCM 12221 / NGA) TaxID=891968 RepID=I4BZC2_ACEMN|nr:hypothetical protein [Acetomicrobium mobile]HOM31467.1 hypothetical protein [Acetomicrobium flavidum]AFM22629.1 hypothetical protein Anamo_2046 [Acetomicrobium mobile DSM 13181]HOP87582.1 hypothetical protein [Acetomicrobium flavidum]HPP14603.1 hypothetical protein [Acetomicrobium flavidum]HPU68851.1 hypothetical protein [Acetomicrobium flavidum]
MSVIECYLCGKGFVTTGPKICPACMKRLDALYMEVRDYIRDNPHLRLNVRELADAMDADPRDIQALVDMGRLELEGEGSDSELLSEKERLLKELEKHLKEDKGRKTARIKYAAEKYGKKEKKKEKDDQ